MTSVMTSLGISRIISKWNFENRSIFDEVNAYKNCCFKTLDISQGSVATHLRCDGILVIVLLQIFSWFWKLNYFENWLIFGKVKSYTKWCQFLGYPVYLLAAYKYAVAGSLSFLFMRDVAITKENTETKCNIVRCSVSLFKVKFTQLSSNGW